MIWLFWLSIVGASILFEGDANTIPLYSDDASLLLVDPSDWPGVIRAANDLVSDFAKVTGNNDSFLLVNASSLPDDDSSRIIVGTVGVSKLIDSLVEEGHLNVSEIEGKWEAYTIVHIEGSNSIVIAGSDKRGTIFGIYSISEQIGVSPWYFWSDVPIESHEAIFFNTSSSPIIQGEPSVKYRGVFINDEEPSLSGWVNDNFREGEYTHYVHEFYSTVFELLLRLKANFLWPAMWKGMFGLDDDLNQYWADYYGIVMSTSHTEPLQRASNEWLYEGEGSWDYTTNKENILKYWEEGIARGKDYEGVWVEGMRGLGDTAMSDLVESSLLEEIIATQRKLLLNGFGNQTNISTIPQVWCLYKEVQSYYQQGMDVPDDIILLWVDDNWGNIRRLPVGNETSRPGGAGVYYHFDYVGDPRNYKWINTVSLERTWEQMNLAYQRDARELWVVNVGDLKGLEIPISYFIDIAYDMDAWGQPNNVPQWTQEWSERQFGDFVDSDSDLDEIADIIDQYGFLASRIKYELVNGSIFSQTNYREADNVLSDWASLADRAWDIYNNSLAEEAQPAFFEMVLHPCQAGYIVYDLYLTAGKNELYASQGRNQANSAASHVRQMFKEDNEWRITWDETLDGKWKHMMDQPHLGYTNWQNPMRETMPFLLELSLGSEAMSGAAGLTIDQSKGTVPGDNQFNAVSYTNNTLIFPELNPYSADTWIEVFNRGYEDFKFDFTPWNDYVTVSPSSGTINAGNDSLWNSMYLNVSVNWDKVKDGYSLEYINFTSNVSTYFYTVPTILFLPINKTKLPTNETFDGFVESQGHVSIEAEHFKSNHSQNGTYHVKLDNFGRTKSAVTLFPVTADSQKATKEASYLEYEFYAFTGSKMANITTILSPSLNTNPKRPLKYAVAVDDDKPTVVQVYKDASDPTQYPDGWEQAVAQSAWIKNTSHNIGPGAHKLKVWLLEPGVAVQKFVIDFGGVQESFLGPPESRAVRQ